MVRRLTLTCPTLSLPTRALFESPLEPWDIAKSTVHAGDLLTACQSVIADLAAQDEPTTPEILYHYTSLTSAQSILCSGVFRLSHTEALEDPNEMQLARLLAPQVLPSILLESGSAPDRRAFIQRLAEYMHQQPPDFVITIDAYVASLCISDSLPNMWSKYGDSARGVVLGFDARLLREPAPDERRSLITIRYQREQQSTIIKDLVMRTWSSAWRILAREYLDDGSTRSHYARSGLLRVAPHVVSTYARMLSCLMKDKEEYEREKESRLLQLDLFVNGKPITPGWNPPRIREQRGRTVRFMEADYASLGVGLPLREIVFGRECPLVIGADPAAVGAIPGVRSLLEAAKLHREFPVRLRVSDCP